MHQRAPAGRRPRGRCATRTPCRWSSASGPARSTRGPRALPAGVARVFSPREKPMFSGTWVKSIPRCASQASPIMLWRASSHTCRHISAGVLPRLRLPGRQRRLARPPDDRRHHLRHVHLQQPLADQRQHPLIRRPLALRVDPVGREEVVVALEAGVPPRQPVRLQRRGGAGGGIQGPGAASG